MDTQTILNCPMGPNDADADNVKDYLKALLGALWDEGEGFSGKRPFGNFGWEYELIEALQEQGLADNRSDAVQQIFNAIEAL